MVLAEVVQDILQRHAQGIAFRERGAGPNLDRDMTPPGFNVEVGVDEGTGSCTEAASITVGRG